MKPYLRFTWKILSHSEKTNKPPEILQYSGPYARLFYQVEDACENLLTVYLLNELWTALLTNQHFVIWTSLHYAWTKTILIPGLMVVEIGIMFEQFPCNPIVI